MTSAVTAPAGLLLLFAWFGLAGIVAPLVSADHLRKNVLYAQPDRLVKHCTIWYAAMLLAGLFAFVVEEREWSARLMISLLAVPSVACFWWQTRSQFRKWEQEQPQPKSYGFPVTLLVHGHPAPPAASPTADREPPASMP